MHVGHSVSTEYTLQEKNHTFKLAEVEEEKDLGIYITNDLKVAKQCKEAAKKAINVKWSKDIFLGLMNRPS